MNPFVWNATEISHYEQLQIKHVKGFRVASAGQFFSWPSLLGSALSTQKLASDLELAGRDSGVRADRPRSTEIIRCVLGGGVVVGGQLASSP